MASIFEIERRKNFVEEFTKFFEDLKTEITIYSGRLPQAPFLPR